MQLNTYYSHPRILSQLIVHSSLELKRSTVELKFRNDLLTDRVIWMWTWVCKSCEGKSCHFTMLSCVTRGKVCVRIVRACGRSGRRALTALCALGSPATPHSLSIEHWLTWNSAGLLAVFPKTKWFGENKSGFVIRWKGKMTIFYCSVKEVFPSRQVGREILYPVSLCSLKNLDTIY